MNSGTPDSVDWVQRLKDKRSGACWWEFSSEDNGDAFAFDWGGVAVNVALYEGNGGEETDVTVAAGERLFSSFF